MLNEATVIVNPDAFLRDPKRMRGERQEISRAPLGIFGGAGSLTSGPRLSNLRKEVRPRMCESCLRGKHRDCPQGTCPCIHRQVSWTPYDWSKLGGIRQ